MSEWACGGMAGPAAPAPESPGPSDDLEGPASGGPEAGSASGGPVPSLERQMVEAMQPSMPGSAREVFTQSSHEVLEIIRT